jgi:hypothetical protein
MPDFQNFWEDQHQHGSSWLTGTTFDQIIRFYSLATQDLENKKFLEIGVGLATVTEPLSRLVDTLYCADISEKALTRARPYATGTWNSQEIHLIPEVDIVLCHLVLVHCDDAECVRILRSINLTTGGKIYCQFSCLKTPDALEHASHTVKPLLVDSGMHFFRTEDQINDILDEAGLLIVNATQADPGSYHGWNGQYWKFYQLERSI